MDEHQMNKQIKELAEKAGLGQERWDTTSQFEAFLEKFAKLVVKECADVAWMEFADAIEQALREKNHG